MSDSPKPNDPARADGAAGEEAPYPPPTYAWYVVVVLLLVYINSFADRQILSLLVSPIKADLGLSDTDMGFLMGIAFALFYSIAGIPLGRLADSVSRRWLIGVGQVFWSIASASCGLVQNFWQFFLARTGVGVGEASLGPAAYSIITDIFPKHRLATALSVYGMGIYLGGGAALMLGGAIIHWTGEAAITLPVVGELSGWRVVFLMVASPVFILTPLLFTIAEPVRRGLKTVQDARGRARSVKASLGETLGFIGANWATFACHTIGFSFLSFSAYGASAWVPSLFERSHGWTRAEVGYIFGIVTMVAGGSGIFCGGLLGDWWAKRGAIDSKMRVGVFAAVAWIPTGIAFPLCTDGAWAMLFLAPTMFLTAMPFGVAPAAIQEMMPPNMRGQGSSIYLFFVNLIGLGLGPFILPQIKDKVFVDYEEAERIRYALLTMTTFAHVAAGLLLWAGLGQFRRSMTRLKDWTRANA